MEHILPQLPEKKHLKQKKFKKNSPEAKRFILSSA
jgi:hypothetical protein